MAHILRPLLQLNRWHRLYSSRPTLHNLINSHSPVNILHSSFITGTPSYHRTVHFRSRGLRFPNASVESSEFADTENDSDSTEKKSRNEKKREARRAVRWATDLAAFSPAQIKRILRVASLETEVLVETEVYDALMLAKRLGRDVREGKRRQFSYIGRLIREVQPELMDGLIQASKDGDMSKFQSLYGSEVVFGKDDVEEESESDDEVEIPEDCINTTNRWFDGLINREMDVSNEIYSVRTVDFDRQELRKLVREVYILQDEVASVEAEGEDKDLLAAKKSLARFLRDIAKQLPSE
ncbi:Ribosome-associated [Heracleum sosnowskyi]|uniref:Ribosome-associated n=1 Tax=Heracleum sosnowskyi TaxID=360622 RepID=A0AAD8IQD0_9APIA|nr:Ribosome-associated [Heracleum sosnowskyi]